MALALAGIQVLIDLGLPDQLGFFIVVLVAFSPTLLLLALKGRADGAIRRPGGRTFRRSGWMILLGGALPLLILGLILAIVGNEDGGTFGFLALFFGAVGFANLRSPDR